MIVTDNPYIAKAEDCERRAETASSPAVRDTFLTAAAGWRRIAAIPGVTLPKIDKIKDRKD